MQLDALKKGDGGKGGKGGKGGDAKGGGAKTCHFCGKPGHFQADCRLRKQQQQQQSGQQPQRQQKGGKGGGKSQADRNKVQCRKCKGFGHIAKDCPTKSLNHVEESGAGGASGSGGTTENPLQALYLNSSALPLCALGCQDIHALRKPTVLRIGVDSGAAASVVPEGATSVRIEQDAQSG
eukprot:1273919-Amphidinium_carterae.1